MPTHTSREVLLAEEPESMMEVCDWSIRTGSRPRARSPMNTFLFCLTMVRRNRVDVIRCLGARPRWQTASKAFDSQILVHKADDKPL